MTDTTPRVGEQRPGGRAERVRSAVLGAAADVLTEVGYDKMSVEEVAVRARVHKTTVYRRWPTKAALTADAAASSDELAATMHGFWAYHLTHSAQIIERAIQRGELPAATDANLIIETVIGPLWIRLLLTGEPITEELADNIVQLVVAGITPTCAGSYAALWTAQPRSMRTPIASRLLRPHLLSDSDLEGHR